MAMIIKHQRPSSVTAATAATRQAGVTVFQVPLSADEARVSRQRAGELAAGEAIPSPDLETLEQAAAIIDQARLEGEALRTAATAEAGMIREQAWHEGYQAGLSEGRAAAAQVVDTSIERLRVLASAAVIDRATLLRDAERQVLDLSLAIARAILHREASLDPTLIATTLDAILAHLQGEVVTSLHAHPDDLPVLTQLWNERARSAADRQVQIVGDHRIARGGCRVETVTGAWDATLDSQLEHIRQASYLLSETTPGAGGESLTEGHAS